MKITFTDNGDGRFFEGREFEMFRARWDDESNDWVADDNGDTWAIYHPSTGEVSPFFGAPTDFGIVTE